MAKEKKSIRQTSVGKALGATRYFMILAVLAIFLGSTILLLVGTLDMFRGVWELFIERSGHGSEELRVVLIESVDTILISTVLYVIAAGLYQLFVDNSLNVPRWLQTQDVSELEQRLSGLVVTIIAVIFLTRAMTGRGTQELLYLGISISAVVIAISIFLWQEKKE